MNAMRGKGGASRALVFGAIGLLVLLPFLYVLSTGPAVWLYSHGFLSGKALDFFYAPLVWACDHCDPLFEFVGWHENFFMPE
jgi:hypothetical protein